MSYIVLYSKVSKQLTFFLYLTIIDYNYYRCTKNWKCKNLNHIQNNYTNVSLTSIRKSRGPIMFFLLWGIHQALMWVSSSKRGAHFELYLWICDWKRGMRDEEDTYENNLHDYKYLNKCMPQWCADTCCAGLCCSPEGTSLGVHTRMMLYW